MAITVFSSGAVLTAAQQNALQANDYNQTVTTKTASYTLVAADVGTRVVMNSASATTITVNTSLFSAGDTLFIQNIGAGVCTVTAGTATVATSGTLALVANAGGTLYFTSASAAVFVASGVTASASGLTLITTAAYTAQTSITVSSVFSATYTNYLLKTRNTTSMAGTATFQLRTGSSTSAVSYYIAGGSMFSDAGAAVDDFSVNNGSGVSLSNTSTGIQMGNLEIIAPFVAANTNFIFNGTFTNATSARGAFNFSAGIHGVATSYESFVLTYPAAQTGNYWLYGYQNS